MTRTRPFIMRYYYYDSKRPDKVKIKKLEKRAKNIQEALELYAPHMVGMPTKCLLNWTAKRVRNDK